MQGASGSSVRGTSADTRSSRKAAPVGTARTRTAFAPYASILTSCAAAVSCTTRQLSAAAALSIVVTTAETFKPLSIVDTNQF
jgi:hypothetical protein